MNLLEIMAHCTVVGTLHRFTSSSLQEALTFIRQNACRFFRSGHSSFNPIEIASVFIRRWWDFRADSRPSTRCHIICINPPNILFHSNKMTTKYNEQYVLMRFTRHDVFWNCRLCGSVNHHKYAPQPKEISTAK